MGIISWIILGGLAGWVASMIMGKNGSMGLIANVIVGIIGAFIGGFVMSQISGYEVTGFNVTSFLVALVGAVILLAIMSMFNKGRVR